MSTTDDAAATTGADALADALVALGVTHIFGMDTPEPLYAALPGRPIRTLTVHDERNGAIMADAFARVSGRPGVCGAIRGPGVTNLLTGLGEARSSSTPVVAIVNDVATEGLGRHSSQELDHVAVSAQVTKWGARVDRPQRVAELAVRAFTQAVSGRPGPVLLSFADSALEQTGARPVAIGRPAFYPALRSGADPHDIERAVALLAAANRPAIVSGGGIHLSQAYEPLRRLAERLDAPVATTPLGKGGIAETHPLAIGVVGSYTAGRAARGRIGNEHVRGADVVLLVGTKTDSIATADWTVPSPGTAIVHIDIDPAEIGRNYPALGLVGDASVVLEQLLAALGDDPVAAEPAEARRGAAAAVREDLTAWDAADHDANSDARPIRSERVLAELADVLDDTAILVTDASYSSAWAMDRIVFDSPGRRFVAPRGFAGIGWGLPAAIGAKLGAPDSTVFCLTGDGGFGYVAMELETAARYRVPIVVIVLNNSILGFQKHFEETKYGTTFETSFLPTDYAALARVLHCEGVRIEHPDELGPALRKAATADGPVLIDVVCDPAVKPSLLTFEPRDGSALGH